MDEFKLKFSKKTLAIISLVFVAIIIVSAIDPVVDWFQKKRVPRSLTVLVVYVVFLAVLATAFGLLIPPLTSEIRGLGESFPSLAEKFSGYFIFQIFIGALLYRHLVIKMSKRYFTQFYPLYTIINAIEHIVVA